MTSLRDEILFELGQQNASIGILLQRADKQDRQLETLTTNVGEIKTRMKPLAEDVTRMKPQIDKYKNDRGRMAFIGSLILAGAGAIGGAVGDYILKKFA